MLATAAALVTCSNAWATLLYWDPAKGSALGGTGTWNTSTAIWAQQSNGSLLTKWGNGSDASFNTSAGTVTVDGTADVMVQNLTFNVSGYTITGGPLTFTGTTPTFSSQINGGSATTISTVLAGTPDVTFRGSATSSSAATYVFTLSGANTYTGATAVSAATLAGIGAHAFGSTSGITLSGTSTLSLLGNSSTPFTKASDSTAYAITAADAATINVDAATSAGTSAKTMTIGSIGTSSTAVTYQLNFKGANSASLVAGGVTGPRSSAATSVNISNKISSPGTLTLASYTSANTTGGEALTFSGSGATVVAGALIPSATSTLSVTQNDVGTLTLQGSSGYTGLTTLNAGTLAFTSVANGGSASALGAASSAFVVKNGSSAATFKYVGAGNAQTDRAIDWQGTASGQLNLDASGTGSVQYLATGNLRSASGNAVLQFQGSNTGGNTLAQVINDPTSAKTAVVKADPGGWTLSGTNGYSGGTTINGGTLRAGNATSSFGSGSVTVNGTGTLAGTGTTGDGDVAVNAGGTITAGSGARSTDTAGTLTVGGKTTISGGSTEVFKIVHATGTAGVDWDRLSLNTLSLSGVSIVPINMKITNGSDASGLTTLVLKAGMTYALFQSKMYPLASLKGAITSNDFVLDTSGLNSGQYSSQMFTLSASAFGSGSELDVTYTATPEPTTAALAGLSASTLLGRRRRRNVFGIANRSRSALHWAA